MLIFLIILGTILYCIAGIFVAGFLHGMDNSAEIHSLVICGFCWPIAACLFLILFLVIGIAFLIDWIVGKIEKHSSFSFFKWLFNKGRCLSKVLGF